MKKKYSNFLTAIVISSLFFVTGCSKDDDDDLKNATHTVDVFTVGMGLLRPSGIKIFMSEKPFESFETFKPISSIEVPEKRNPENPLVMNVSNYVGKTVYFIALRKHLLSDDYYSVTSLTPNQSLKDISVTIKEETAKYQVGIVTEEPKSENYRQDVAKVSLYVKKGSTGVLGRNVYHYSSEFWSDEIKKTLETTYQTNSSAFNQKFKPLGKTVESGLLPLNILIDETGVVGKTNYNEHIFFVFDDNKKLQEVRVNVNALKLSATIQY